MPKDEHRAPFPAGSLQGRRPRLVRAKVAVVEKPPAVLVKTAPKAEKKPKKPRRFVGIDGEGVTLPDGRHLYIYLAAVDEDGVLVADAYDPNGLSHQACLDMLFQIPRNTVNFGFMFSYDFTKIIEEVPKEFIFRIMRPDTRRRRICRTDGCGSRRYVTAWFDRDPNCDRCGGPTRTATTPLYWRGHTYDYFNGKVAFASEGLKREHRTSKHRVREHRTEIWDVFRFFQCSFVNALKAWNVGTEAQRARILGMKEKRGTFSAEEAEAIRAYCREECQLLAVMMRKLVDACEQADLDLTDYYGAGSIAKALLKKNQVALYRGAKLEDLPTGVQLGTSCAFFGGRFENCVIGETTRKVYGYDIASAYPYAQTFHPCLACGEWRYAPKVTAALLEESVRRPGLVVLGRYAVRGGFSAAERARMAWCPLPFRTDEGSIVFGVGHRGWAWGPELLPALRGWPDLVRLGEGWVYETSCDHRPFSFLPDAYRTRVAWGKEGAGIVLKLGPNASYGKLAQRVGDNPPFASLVWAGLTTATCRGQILSAIASARDPWKVYSIATDGIYSGEELTLGTPRTKGDQLIFMPERDTGTSDLPKPLGCWEVKSIDEGAVFFKPGIYFRLDAKPDDIRARGVGRKAVYTEREVMRQKMQAWDRESYDYTINLPSEGFAGAKTSILMFSRCRACKTTWPGIPEVCCRVCKKKGEGEVCVRMKRTALCTHKLNAECEHCRIAYGTWSKGEVENALTPRPKRETVLYRKGESLSRMRIIDNQGKESAAYLAEKLSPEALLDVLARENAEEQPDLFEDY